MMAAGSIFAFKIVAKQLQTETCLSLTDYSHSSSPYRVIPSLTPYDVQFSNNTRVKGGRRQATDDKLKLYPRLDLAVGQKLMPVKNSTQSEK